MNALRRSEYIWKSAVFALGLMTALAGCGGPDAKPGAPRSAAAASVEGSGLPGLRDRAALYNGWLRERFDAVLPAIMRREGIDMWIVVCREHAEDPVYPTLMPQPHMFAWKLTMLVFHDPGAPADLEAISVNPYGGGDFNRELADYYRPGWTDQAEEPWARLARLVRERDPKRIAIDESATFAFADGLSATLKADLAAALGPGLSSRLVSAERLVVGWMEKRTAGEIDLFARLAALNRRVAAEALSSKVIKPGVTTLADLSWWTRERFAALGVEPWFQPSYYIVRRTGGPADETLRRTVLPGDLVRCDIGFSCLGMTTDIQEAAYVLRDGETGAPAGLDRAMWSGNRLQDILTAEFVEGRTGNEILAAALAKGKAEGLRPSIYSHPLNRYGHGAGPKIGPAAVPGAGDYPLYANTCWAVELSVAANVPEWGGQEVGFALEQSAVFTRAGVVFPAGRQTEIHLVGAPAGAKTAK